MARTDGAAPLRRSREETAEYLARLEKVRLAQALIARGARQMLLVWATQLPLDRLVGLYRHHLSSNAVMFPTGANQRPSTLVKDPGRAIQASLFAAALRHDQPRATDLSLTPAALLRAYDLYRVLDPQPLSITDAYFVARYLRTGDLVQRWCAQCAVHYLVAVAKAELPCPLCVVAGAAPVASCDQDCLDAVHVSES